MANVIVNKVDLDDLNDWLYTQGIDQLSELSNLACESAYFLAATDEDGVPTDNCKDAISKHNDLNRFLSVFNLVKNQISIMES